MKFQGQIITDHTTGALVKKKSHIIKHVTSHRLKLTGLVNSIQEVTNANWHALLTLHMYILYRLLLQVVSELSFVCVWTTWLLSAYKGKPAGPWKAPRPPPAPSTGFPSDSSITHTLYCSTKKSIPYSIYVGKLREHIKLWLYRRQCRPVGWSSTLVKNEMSQQLLDGCTFMVPTQSIKLLW